MTVIIDCPSCNAGIRPPIPAVCPDCGYALMGSKAPPPTPTKPTDQRACAKCGGMEHKVFYFTNDGCEIKRSWLTCKTTVFRYLICDRLKCPSDVEHLHIGCKTCGYEHWEHCADHVEEGAPESGDGEEAP